MSRLRSVGYALVGIGVAAGAAAAETDAELVARGQELGKQGEWTRAVATFKEADAIAQKTEHACLIALAYTRREMWPQAELYFARCHQRATAADPLPEWAADAEKQLADKLASAAVPAIELVVEPSDAAATLTVSGFDPGDTLSAGIVHMPAGRYTIRATAPDYLPSQREIVVEAGHPQRVTFRLGVARKPNPARASKLGWWVGGAGVALVAAGVVTDLAKVQPLRDQMAKSRFEYDAHEGELSTWRWTTIGLWGTGAVAVGVGAYLLIRREQLPLTVHARVERGGGMFAVEWMR